MQPPSTRRMWMRLSNSRVLLPGASGKKTLMGSAAGPEMDTIVARETLTSVCIT